jgi:hypothetical protein
VSHPSNGIYFIHCPSTNVKYSCDIRS